MVSQEKLRELKIFAADIRIAAIKSIQSIGVGHVGGSMSVCDLMACLYGEVMSLRSNEPRWEERDRFIMS